jgi:hypothetical protein
MMLNNGCWTRSFVASIAVVCIFVISTLTQDSNFAVFGRKRHHDTVFGQSTTDNSCSSVLKRLSDAGVYDAHDFANEMGIIPPYWEKSRRQPSAQATLEWGPCYGTTHEIDWNAEIEMFRHGDQQPRYPKAPSSKVITKADQNFENYCRPGFLIIGAGKCGTSVRVAVISRNRCAGPMCLLLPSSLQSLYHYITYHPRVLPASEKQIHYFKYFADRPMQWYLHHFPSATSFLASGTLITGEASPGYLPYPDVVQLVKKRLPVPPRIIVIGREPVDRAYSSYRYNYVAPALEAMRGGQIVGVQPGLSDDYYHRYLFSFEEMVQAELGILRKCLTVPNGSAVAGARSRWANQSWAEPEYSRREKLGLAPLVDLDGYCYGSKVSKSVLREQWIDLLARHPTKVIPARNVHLIQSIVGRGLYALPLEWWYAVFDHAGIYFVCTEELTDMTGEPINKVGQFLGLPSFNFSATVSRGAYNVGSHKGYDNEVSWSILENERSIGSAMTNQSAVPQEIPLSDSVRRELTEFYRPYNERLFQLVGRRCTW